MSGFFVLPDRQVIYLLDYLRTKLRGDKNAKAWLDTSDQIVDGTIARNPKRMVVYKGEPMWELHAAQMPYLGLWRVRNHAKRDLQWPETRAACGLGWFARIPGGGGDHDPETWGSTIASNMWHLCRDHLEEIPLETRQKAACGSVILGDGDIDVDLTESICGFIADLTIIHEKPPYQVEDLNALREVAISIKLYDSSQMGGDGIQGLYQGYTLEAEQ